MLKSAATWLEPKIKLKVSSLRETVCRQSDETICQEAKMSRWALCLRSAAGKDSIRILTVFSVGIISRWGVVPPVRWTTCVGLDRVNDTYVVSPGSPRLTSSSSWFCLVSGAQTDQGRGLRWGAAGSRLCRWGGGDGGSCGGRRGDGGGGCIFGQRRKGFYNWASVYLKH